MDEPCWSAEEHWNLNWLFAFNWPDKDINMLALEQHLGLAILATGQILQIGPRSRLWLVSLDGLSRLDSQS